jgi:hypothetical protein
MEDEVMTDIETWFTETFWPLYPSDLSQGKKGPKTVALKSILKLNPDEDMRQSIINKMRVLIHSAKTEKRCGKEPDRWPFASTWINQERWNSIEDMAQPSSITDKRKCECGNDATIQDKCWACHESTDPQHKVHMQWLYDALVEQGLGIKEFPDKAAWIAACKERTIPRLAKLRAKRDLGEFNNC